MRKLKDRTCLICNKDFQSTWNKKTCSKQCEMSYKRLKKFIKKHTKVQLVKLKHHLYKKRVCSYCGKIFKPNIHNSAKNKKYIYCSRKCFKRVYELNRQKNPKHTRICKECGKEFKTNNKTNFCSSRCSLNYNNRQKNLQKRIKQEQKFKQIAFIKLTNFIEHKEWQEKDGILYTDTRLLKGTIGICQTCGRKFYYIDSENGYGNGTFCSRECYFESMKTYVKNICLYCGKEFSVVKQDKNYQQFCSEECKDDFINELQNGIRTYPHDYHKLTCINCNKTFYDFELHSEFFCSFKCEYDFKLKSKAVKKNCLNCNNEFFTATDTSFCSTSCISAYHAKQIGLGKAIRPEKVWNDGLTKETDKRIAIQAKNDSHKKLEDIKNGKLNPANNRALHGYFSLFNHYIRSGWEFNFALILKYCKRNYQYESRIFYFQDGTGYLPDFYDEKRDIYYEIKGFMYKHAKESLEKMKLEYPYVKLHLITKQKYTRIYNHFISKLKLIKYREGNNHNGTFYTKEELENLRISK